MKFNLTFFKIHIFIFYLWIHSFQIEVLQAEVQALKTLVITSTPSMPNPHLHPQIDKRNNGVRSLFTQGHKRSPSNYELCSYKETPPGSPTKEVGLSEFTPDNYEVKFFIAKLMEYIICKRKSHNLLASFTI